MDLIDFQLNLTGIVQYQSSPDSALKLKTSVLGIVIGVDVMAYSSDRSGVIFVGE